MSAKKVFGLCLLFNVAWLSLVVGVLAWTQPARAQAPAGAPAETTLGPYYVSFSGADFQAWSDVDYPIFRSGFGLKRNSSFGIGITGLRLPPGAAITSITNDSDIVSGGKTQVLLMRCPVGALNCLEIARSEDSLQGRNQTTTNLTYAVNGQSESYFLQVNLPDDSSFYNAFIGYTLPSTALFMPAILR